jgi:MscS family membrane protein
MAFLELLFENEYAYALLILIASAVFAMVFNFILNKYVRSLTRKTKTDLDDVILGIITKPLYVLIIFVGVYFGLKSLSVLQAYDAWIERIFSFLF